MSRPNTERDIKDSHALKKSNGTNENAMGGQQRGKSTVVWCNIFIRTSRRACLIYFALRVAYCPPLPCLSGRSEFFRVVSKTGKSVNIMCHLIQYFTGIYLRHIHRDTSHVESQYASKKFRIGLQRNFRKTKRIFYSKKKARTLQGTRYFIILEWIIHKLYFIHYISFYFSIKSTHVWVSAVLIMMHAWQTRWTF